MKIVRDSPGGIGGFSRRLSRFASGPVLAEAALAGDKHAVSLIWDIASLPGFNINSLQLRGQLRTTAVHIAASAGNVEALQALLELKADPNAEDHIRETYRCPYSC